MDECQKYRIIFCVKMVLKKLMEKYPNTRREVLDVMGGKVVECEVDRILERGRKQGVAQGVELGRSELIENMLNNHKTPAEIAEFCNCDLKEITEVQKKMHINV